MIRRRTPLRPAAPVRWPSFRTQAFFCALVQPLPHRAPSLCLLGRERGAKPLRELPFIAPAPIYSQKGNDWYKLTQERGVSFRPMRRFCNRRTIDRLKKVQGPLLRSFRGCSRTHRPTVCPVPSTIMACIASIQAVARVSAPKVRLVAGCTTPRRRTAVFRADIHVRINGFLLFRPKHPG